MSNVKRRLEKLGAQIDGDVPAWVRAMSNEEITARLAEMAADLRRPDAAGRSCIDPAALGPRRPALAHLSDDEVLERLAAARAAVAAEQRGGKP